MTDAIDDTAYAEKIAQIHDHVVTRSHDKAVELADQLMKASPDKPAAYFMLGLYAFSQRNFGDAIELFNAAHERAPDCREYADCLAVLYTVIGKLSDGLYFAKLATTLDSDPAILPYIPYQLSNYFEALDRIEPSQHYINGLLLFNVGKYEDAARSCELELKQNDQHDRCYTLLGRCQIQLGDYDKAVNALHSAIHIDSYYAESHSLLGTALTHLGRFAEATACHERALALNTETLAPAAAARLDAEHLADGAEPVRTALAKEITRRVALHPLSDISYAHEASQKDRIRIGYVSNALYDCDQAKFIAAVLANHDRGRFEIFCYQQSISEDTVNVELQNSADNWRAVFDLDDPIFGVILNGDEIDILVDLCGYSLGNRAQLFASRARPVQMAWLEPPYGIGADGIDFVLSDAATRDADKAALGKGQAILDMDAGLMALDPFTFFPDVGELPASKYGDLLFGGQCDLAFLTPETAAAWARVLSATGRSKLVLGDAGTLSNTVKNQAIELFAHFGLANRIIFHDDPPEDRLGVDFFRQIDVLLDTTPVSGRMNLCKALWMGVPVICLKGTRRAGRIGASILNAADQGQWIADTPEHMAEIAAGFAGDLDGLAAIRHGLRDAVTASNLFNPKALTRSVEAAFGAALKGGKATVKKPPKKKAAPKAKPAPKKKAGAKKKSK